MPLSLPEKERVRYHLGYLSVQPAASIQFGLPRPQQTQFMVESAMNLLLEEAIPRVRDTLDTLDGIECRLRDGALDRLAAKRLGDLELRDGEPELLEDEYNRWAKRLADIFGVPLYPYAARFKRGVRTGTLQVS